MPSVFPCSTSDMEEGNRFEEVDDAFLEEWADVGELKEERDCSFAKMYGPIRALFATDSVVLAKFEDCLDHMERLSFLLNMEVSRLFTSNGVVLLLTVTSRCPQKQKQMDITFNCQPLVLSVIFAIAALEFILPHTHVADE